MVYMLIFLLKKNMSSFKLLIFFFSKNTCIVLARTVNILTTYELFKLKRQSFLPLFYYTAVGVSAVWRRKNVFPYITIVRIILYFLWDKWAHCSIGIIGLFVVYLSSAHVYAGVGGGGGVSSVANFITAYEESQ